MDKWITNVVSTDRLEIILSVLRIFIKQYDIVPEQKHVLNTFRMIAPSHVKVVFLGESPYPGRCPATGVLYACGPAFMLNPDCATTPVLLLRLLNELRRDLGITRLMVPSNQLLKDWVQQGVLLLNASLTLGAGGCPKHLQDHSLLWKEFMCTLVNNLSCHFDPIFVLIGTQAWHFEQFITSPVIKVCNPDNDMFLGCGVFQKVSAQMCARGHAPIDWYRF